MNLHELEVRTIPQAEEGHWRPAIIARKLSCGNKAQRGKQTCETLACSPLPAPNQAKTPSTSSTPPSPSQLTSLPRTRNRH